MDNSELFDFTNILVRLDIIPPYLRDAVDNIVAFPNTELSNHLKRLAREGILKDILLYTYKRSDT